MSLSTSVRGVSNRESQLLFNLILLCFASFNAQAESITYPIVDTNQTQCSNHRHILEKCPKEGDIAFGQDAQYQGRLPSYTSNTNGTVTDNHTGLIWAQTIDTNGDGKITAADKMTYEQALIYAANLRLAGYVDWRLPSIKELYSLIMFDGQDPSGPIRGKMSIRPFIDHEVFGFESGDLLAGERLIDSQYVSSTRYVSKTMKVDDTVFGVNFIDGRIKGYGTEKRNHREKTFYVLVVRGNTDYGLNDFSIHGSELIHDRATGLTWQRTDSQRGMSWPAALEYCERLELAGQEDWRLPSIKELQSIVNYSRSPNATNSAAISPEFSISTIKNEAGIRDYPNFWSSTTHINLNNANNAAYIAFGRSLGFMHGVWLDVHGAGSQRSAPKVVGKRSYPKGKGPQGDAIRTDNYVRCVSGGGVEKIADPKEQIRVSRLYDFTDVLLMKND